MRTEWTGSAGMPVWLRPRLGAPWAEALSSSRLGGVSAPPYQSLNVGRHVGDDPEAVQANRRRCAEESGVPLERWVFAEQVHGAKVAVVDANAAGAGTNSANPAIPGADALVTTEPGLVLAIQTADCVPVLFVDPDQRVVGAAHSGWRGTVLGISGRVVRVMQEGFGSRPDRLHVWLGPSIRACCYEVDERVAAEVRHVFGHRPLWRRFGRPDKWWLSLQACIRMDLTAAGVDPARIADCGECTACRTRHFYSHRAEAGRTGRQLTAVWIRDPV
jgi:YfiH family protein